MGGKKTLMEGGSNLFVSPVSVPLLHRRGNTGGASSVAWEPNGLDDPHMGLG